MHASFVIAAVAAPVFAVSLAAPSAAGQEPTSAYTKIDIRRDCKHHEGVVVEDYGDWVCAGYAGVPMWLGAGDQRMFVSFGRRAAREPAAEQTLAPFNDFYEGTVEWRLEGARPFATIMRWNYQTPADRRVATGRVLVVTRLPPGPVCHVGYVDARANPDANQLARDIADAHARNFQCGHDKPITLGRVRPEAPFR
jgi:hypothetical protein